MITISARIKDGPTLPHLEACARLLSRLERKLFVALYAHQEEVKDAKRRFIADYQITGRQFNGLHNQVQAKVASWVECQKLNLTNTLERIEKTRARIKRVKCPRYVHQQKRRVTALEGQAQKIRAKLAAQVPAICFGTKKLFHAQFDLEENDYPDQAAWLAEWQATRSSGVFLLGASSESRGNQNCQYQDDQIRLRLPDGLGGQTITFPVDFRYRKAELLRALEPREQEFKRGPQQGQAVERGNSVSYRFVRRGAKWYVQASFEPVPVSPTTDRRCGAVGVDLNPWGLAVTRLDRFGNIVETFDLVWTLFGRTSDQIEAAIGERVRAAVAYARKHGVPVAIERLDFTEAKKANRGKGLNRMLSGFAYAAFGRLMAGRCAREQVELIQVNPAFTSVIGNVKFAQGYGLSVHRAAAATIARRALNFGEKLCARHTGNAPVLPVRKRLRHVWSDWGIVAKAARLRKQRDIRKGRSQTPATAGPPGPILATTRVSRVVTSRARRVARGATPQANRQKHCSSGVVRNPLSSDASQP